MTLLFILSDCPNNSSCCDINMTHLDFIIIANEDLKFPVIYRHLMFLQVAILSMPFLRLLWMHSPTCSFTPAHNTGDNCPQGGPSRISISRPLHITTHCNHKDEVTRRRLLLEQECKLHHNVITAQRRTNPTKRKRRKIDNIYVQFISQSWRYWPWNKLI